MFEPSFENYTPYEFAPLSLANQDGQPLFVLIVKATFTIQPQQNTVLLSDEQIPVNLEGEYWGEPGKSSFRYEPEVAFFKPHTDIVLLGHAQSEKGKVKELGVSLTVGENKKVARVTGDRQWIKQYGFINMSDPLPFERIPLTYEYAFGGWDKSHPDENYHIFDTHNPVGRGFRESSKNYEEGIYLPNIEGLHNTIESFGQVVTPAGFGFVCPEWQPRANYAGSFDEQWEKTRKPLLPLDFNPLFMNAAPHDLIAKNFINGDESVEIINASSQNRLCFNLPGILAPQCLVALKNGQDEYPQLVLDTLIIDTDNMHIQVLWRGHVLLQDGPLDVRTIVIRDNKQ